MASAFNRDALLVFDVGLSTSGISRKSSILSFPTRTFLFRTSSAIGTFSTVYYYPAIHSTHLSNTKVEEMDAQPTEHI